jgi:hypothetical protein
MYLPRKNQLNIQYPTLNIQQNKWKNTSVYHDKQCQRYCRKMFVHYLACLELFEFQGHIEFLDLAVHTMVQLSQR